ncbi:NAD(P)H-dependent oxidoreductase [Oceaniovalibus sp. ACAM 378]|uniref:NAD(P)H-dependent oxidoreductase n=1 Tax=Oceaniovalibus sp. ACAM 378 TaxID=2599923 RepID=UPI0021052A99|nr:NAD(P)H-dependent oxidoreductase [Oceaniovalibus sp. ACAM 378]
MLCISGTLHKASNNCKMLAEAARLNGRPHADADLRLPLYDGDFETSDGIPGAVEHWQHKSQRPERS